MDHTLQPEQSQQPPLNTAQLHLLQVFSQIKKEEDWKELQAILLDFYQRKLDEEADALWKNRRLDNDQMKKMMFGHARTSQK
jgi:hypothetical protein